MKFFLTLLVSLSFLQCSQLIWKKAKLAEEVSPGSDPKESLVLTVEYEEKDSWNPLNGTTDKRNYRSVIRLYSSSDTKTKAKREWNLPSWALGDGIFYHSGADTLFVLYGKDDEYGTLQQTLSIYPAVGGPFSYPAKPENRIIFQMAPSPKGTEVALITANRDSQNEYSEFELNLIQLPSKNVQTYPLSFWTALPMYGMRWAEDGGSLFIRTPDEVLKLTASGLTPTKSFPDCYSVSTNYGKWAYETAEVEQGGNIQIGKKLPPPSMISNLDKIRLCR